MLISCFVSVDGKGLASVSNHPPHIIDQHRAINPSSFIPFCYFGERALGEKIANFSEPVCILSVPKNIGGQLCYSIDINSALRENTVDQGESSALILYLDYNEESSTWMDIDQQENAGLGVKMDMITESKIIIETITPFVTYGGGHFLLSNVQETKTTKDFDNLSGMSRGCALQDEAKSRFENAGLASCKCIPFEVSEPTSEGVYLIFG